MPMFCPCRFSDVDDKNQGNTHAKPAVRLLGYAQDTFGIPINMYIHKKTASSAPNYQFFETAQYLSGPTLLLHGEP